jgi:hypothetical protein
MDKVPIPLPATALGRAVVIVVFIIVGGVGTWLTFETLGSPQAGEGVSLERLLLGAVALVVACVVGSVVGLHVDRWQRRR